MEEKSYELSNHLGNVHITLSDYRRKEEDGLGVVYFSQVKSASDYYPFGQLLTEGNYSAGSYRFGYNSQEKDDEIFGSTGSFLNFKYRGYDTRTGQFWSVDPLAPDYPAWSPYHFAQRTPIWARELEGLEAWYTTTESGDQELIQGAAGPLSQSSIEEIVATHYGLLENQPDYSFSDQEIQDFSDWNATNGSTEPGYCLGCATTGSEVLTGADAGFRNSSGNNVLSGKTLYDLGANLEKTGNATELPTSQGQETTTMLNNPNAAGTANTAYIAGPAGAYHSIIITRQTSNNQFSIFDQGTGWDVKNTTQQGAQNQINDINSIHPNWGSRIWQIYKTKKVEVLYPVGN